MQICKNTDRVSIARKNCAKVSLDNHKTLHPSHYKHILVDDKHKMLYCAIPGTGYKSIKKLLAFHSGRIESGTPPYPEGDDTEFLSKLGLEYLDKFSSEDIDMKLEHYLKFILVRHPMVRLKSTFAKMFMRTNNGIEKYQEVIAEYYDRSKLTKSKNGLLTISFYQFLQLITETNQFRDARWRSYYGTCHPCDIDYDIILKLETIQHDIHPIMDHLAHASGNKSDFSPYEVFWNINNLKQYRNTNEIVKTIPSKLLNRTLTYYEKDLDIFGYDWDNKTGIHCSSKKTTHMDCC